MPGLYLYGRRWHVATDTFPLVSMFLAIVHTCMLIPFMTGTYSIESTGIRYDCAVGAYVRTGVYGMLVLYAVAAVIEWCVSLIGLRGGPLEERKRRPMRPLLYSEVTLWFVILGWTIFSTFVVKSPAIGSGCWSNSPCIYSTDLPIVCNRNSKGYRTLTPECLYVVDNQAIFNPCLSSWIYYSFSAYSIANETAVEVDEVPCNELTTLVKQLMTDAEVEGGQGTTTPPSPPDSADSQDDWGVLFPSPPPPSPGELYAPPPPSSETSPPPPLDADSSADGFTFYLPEVVATREGVALYNRELQSYKNWTSKLFVEINEGLNIPFNHSAPGSSVPFFHCMPTSCQPMIVALEECSQWNAILSYPRPGSRKGFFQGLVWASWAVLAFEIVVVFVSFNSFPDYDDPDSWEGSLGVFAKLCCCAGVISAELPVSIGKAEQKDREALARLRDASAGGDDGAEQRAAGDSESDVRGKGEGLSPRSDEGGSSEDTGGARRKVARGALSKDTARREIARSLAILFGAIDLDPTDRLIGAMLAAELQSGRRRWHVLNTLARAGFVEHRRGGGSYFVKPSTENVRLHGPKPSVRITSLSKRRTTLSSGASLSVRRGRSASGLNNSFSVHGGRLARGPGTPVDVHPEALSDGGRLKPDVGLAGDAAPEPGPPGTAGAEGSRLPSSLRAPGGAKPLPTSPFGAAAPASIAAADGSPAAAASPRAAPAPGVASANLGRSPFGWVPSFHESSSASLAPGYARASRSTLPVYRNIVLVADMPPPAWRTRGQPSSEDSSEGALRSADSFAMADGISAGIDGQRRDMSFAAWTWRLLARIVHGLCITPLRALRRVLSADRGFEELYGASHLRAVSAAERTRAQFVHDVNLRSRARYAPILTPVGLPHGLRELVGPREAAEIYSGRHPTVDLQVLRQAAAFSTLAVSSYGLQAALWAGGSKPPAGLALGNLLLSVVSSRSARLRRHLEAKNLELVRQAAGCTEVADAAGPRANRGPKTRGRPSPCGEGGGPGGTPALPDGPSPDLLYANYANSPGGILPYLVVVNRKTKTIVLSIRGTVGFKDLVTDLLSSPIDISEWVPEAVLERAGADDAPLLAHVGVVSSTTAILHDLHESGVLGDLLAAQVEREEIARAAGLAPPVGCGLTADPWEPPERTSSAWPAGAGLDALRRAASALGHGRPTGGVHSPPHRGPASATSPPRPGAPASGEAEAGAPESARSGDLLHEGRRRSSLGRMSAAGSRRDPLRPPDEALDRLEQAATTPGPTFRADRKQARELVDRERRAAIIRKALVEDGYDLVVTGHSLGAAVASLLTMQLRPRFPTLHCWAFCPPGGLFSWNLAVESRSHTTSVVVGKDAIARLSFTNVQRAIDEIVLALARCQRPKLAVLHDFLFTKAGFRGGDSTFCALEDVSNEAIEALARYHATAAKRPRLIEMYPPGNIIFLRSFKEGTGRASVHVPENLAPQADAGLAAARADAGLNPDGATFGAPAARAPGATPCLRGIPPPELDLEGAGARGAYRAAAVPEHRGRTSGGGDAGPGDARYPVSPAAQRSAAPGSAAAKPGSSAAPGPRPKNYVGWDAVWVDATVLMGEGLLLAPSMLRNHRMFSMAQAFESIFAEEPSAGPGDKAAAQALRRASVMLETPSDTFHGSGTLQTVAERFSDS